MTRIDEVLLSSSAHSVDLCVTFALLWIATGGGSVSAQKHSFIREKLSTEEDGEVNTEALLNVIAAKDMTSFDKVFETLSRELSAEEKKFFLELAIGVAVADGPLSTAANHMLRFYADLLGLGLRGLESLYRVVGGDELPAPGDPSSLAWWQVKESRSRKKRSTSNGASGLSRQEAMALLGVDNSSSPAEVKKAYKRMVQSYHPDRYETLGNEAKRMAQRIFLRIQHAYDVLSQ